MTIIENSISYSGKEKAKRDCESGNASASAMPVPCHCCCCSIHIPVRALIEGKQLTERCVVSTPRANFFSSCLESTLYAIVLSAAIAALLALLLPLRPSNLILWKTNTRSCDEVRSALLYQLENWTETFPAYTNCSSYQVLSTEPHALWLYHRAEWKSAAYEADISLLSTPRPNTCYVLARCMSRGSEWPLDGGASLCFLAADSSFLRSLTSQFTDDPFCTQFSSVGLKIIVCQDESENMQLVQSLLNERGWLRSVDRAATS